MNLLVSKHSHSCSYGVAATEFPPGKQDQSSYWVQQTFSLPVVQWHE